MIALLFIYEDFLCAKHRARRFKGMYLIWPFQQLYKVDAVIIPILQWERMLKMYKDQSSWASTKPFGVYLLLGEITANPPTTTGQIALPSYPSRKCKWRKGKRGLFLGRKDNWQTGWS